MKPTLKFDRDESKEDSLPPKAGMDGRCHRFVNSCHMLNKKNMMITRREKLAISDCPTTKRKKIQNIFQKKADLEEQNEEVAATESRVEGLSLVLYPTPPNR